MIDGDTSENPDAKVADEEELNRERYELLQRLEGWLETPMLVLAFVRRGCETYSMDIKARQTKRCSRPEPHARFL